MADAPSVFEGPATLVFTRHVRPGREAAYRAWVEGIQHVSAGIKGFAGAGTLRHPSDENSYVSIVRFDSYDDLAAWERSDVRRAWLPKLPEGTVVGDASVRTLEGVEMWFAPEATPKSAMPSRHKMALVLAFVVLALVSMLGPLVRLALGEAPPFARTVVTVLLQVGLMTYVIMPRVTVWLSRWLFR